jgi:hypothetical protein
MQISYEDSYLFDLRGYLVLGEVLSTDEVAELNRHIDDHGPADPGAELAEQLFGGYLLWDQAFRRLIDHPRVLPYLREWVDPHVRLDRYYGIHMRPGTTGLPLHGGVPDHDPTEYYRFRDGRPVNGITTVSWALSDMLPGQGGLVCIPGSHKSNMAWPRRFDHTADCATLIPLRAGDVVIFTGAIAHGTYPWHGPHLRRTLIYKYAPAHIAWSSGYLEWSPELCSLLTPRQRELLEPPHGTPGYDANQRPSYMRAGALPETMSDDAVEARR